MIDVQVFGKSAAMARVAQLLDGIDGVSRVTVVEAARAGHSVVSAAARPRTVDAMLRKASDSTDVGEHWLEAGAPLGVELDAIRTSLRSGRVVMARSPEPGARWVFIAGFDAAGAFLVRDPRG